MSSIDNRIVNMQFNNSGFESGVKTTLNSLKSLDEKLKMKNAGKGLEGIDEGIKKLSNNGLNGIASSVDTVSSRFSALGVIGMTALMNITNSAVNAGKNLVKSFTIAPIMDGFNEYELKMNSIQTILTNTASKGTTLDQVNAALNELNTYADKTIYNFAEMTKNIGTFTAAGVDLDTSVSSIKGIANLAAASGSSSQQASTAMYQLSQALAAGRVALADWNSVVNAGMGGELFQNALIRTSEVLGTGADKAIKKYGSFRDSLTKGEWLTTEVLTETLNQIAGAYSEADLLAQGYTKSQAKEILELAKNAEDAATKVKTATQLIDTVKEAIGSGWAQTWETIIGDKGEATELFTGISNAIEGIVNKTSDARNDMLSKWKELGGRDDLISGFSNIAETLGKAFGSVGDAWRDIFPQMTGKQLADITKGFKNLTENFKMSDETAGKIKNTFKGLFSILDLGKTGITSIVKAFTPMGGIFKTLSGGLITITSSIGKFFSAISKGAKDSGVFEKLGNSISNGLKGIDKFLSNAAKSVSEFFSLLSGMNFKPVFDLINNVGSGLGKGLESVFSGIGKAIGGMNINAVFGALAAIAGGKALKTIDNIGQTFTGMFKSVSGISKGVTGVLDGVKESLQAYQNDLNAGILLKLAAAIGILALSLSMLSTINANDMSTALTGITVLFVELVAAMAGLLKLAAGTNLKGFWTISTSLLALSTSMLILASAVKKLADLSPGQLATGLIGIAGAMVVLGAAVKIISGSTKGLIKGGTGMILLAVALKEMANAVKMFSAIDPEAMGAGLFGLGLLLAELAAFLKVTDFGGLGIKSSVGVLILAGALQVLSGAVDKFGSMDTNAMIQGLAGVGAMLLEIAAFSALTSGGLGLIATATAMVIMGAAMRILSGAIESMGSIQWENIARGLTAMAGALLIIGVAVMAIPGGLLAGMAVGLGLMSGALMLLSVALKSLSGMAWDEIGRSLVVLAGSLTILAVAMKLMTTGLPGAAAMLVMSAALMVFVPQLIALSQLSLGQIGIGLLALAGAFTVLGVAGLLLTPLAMPIALLAGAVTLLGIGCLAAGAGVTLLAGGLATLATVGVAGSFALAEGFKQLIALIPELAKNLAEGLVNFIVQIGESVPQIVTAFGQMISGILEAFTTAIPQIANAALELITALCTTLGSAIPQLVTVGVNMILAILEGISSNMGRITTCAVNIIVQFLNTISANAGRLIQAGITCAVSLINGLANGIRSNSGAVTGAIMNLVSACITALGGAIGQFFSKGAESVANYVKGLLGGKGSAQSAGKGVADSAKSGAQSGSSGMSGIGSQMIQGLIGGIQSMASSVASAASSVVKGAVNAAKAALGIHSPSRVFKSIGKYTVMGFSDGIRHNGEMAKSATTDLANKAVKTMSNSIAKVTKALNSEMDFDPTIKPVIDLSNVKKGSKTIQELISNSGLNIGGKTSEILTKSITQIQNGNDNSDIISALKDLKSTLKDSGGTTYQVNGVTYDDGSNVSNAVESLIHAAIIERRK